MLGIIGRIPILIGWMDLVVELAEALSSSRKLSHSNTHPLNCDQQPVFTRTSALILNTRKSRFWLRLGCDAPTRSINSRTSAFTLRYTCHASTTNTFASHSSIWSSPRLYLPTQLCASCRKSWADHHS